MKAFGNEVCIVFKPTVIDLARGQCMGNENWRLFCMTAQSEGAPGRNKASKLYTDGYT